jgi:hypothetical protein
LDQNSTKELNLTVLQRMDRHVEDILTTAAHVTFYQFSVEDSQWVTRNSFTQTSPTTTAAAAAATPPPPPPSHLCGCGSLFLLVLVLYGGLFSFFCNVFSLLLTAGCQACKLLRLCFTHAVRVFLTHFS